MRRFVGLIVALGAVSSCYVPKRIVVPPSEDGLNCMRECMSKHEGCNVRPAMRNCREDYDRCLMVCPGAKEDSTPEADTPKLPGVY